MGLLLSAVKYIREVSPLFKKPSLVADLPWDGVRPQSPSYSGSEDSGSPKHSSSSSPSKDRKVISLKMCFISRNLSMPDLENRSGAADTYLGVWEVRCGLCGGFVAISCSFLWNVCSLGSSVQRSMN